MENPLTAKTVMPAGYTPTPSTSVALPTLPIPTPPSQAYTPNTSFINPLPGLLTAPDSQRQFYGKGPNVNRFWPMTNNS